MPKSTSLNLPQNANNQSIALTSADTTTPKLAFTAGANDSDVKAIIAASNDTAAVNLQLFIVRGAVNYLLGTIGIPAGAGNDGVGASIDMLARDTGFIPAPILGLPLDNVGKPYIPLKSGDTLKIGCVATMTAAKTCYVSFFGEDY